MNYLGIDNGISGGLALVSEQGLMVYYTAMPTQQTRKGNEIDVRTLRLWLDDHHILPVNAVAVIEEPGGSKSAAAGASMAGSFHALRSLLELRGFRHARVTPQKWQKEILNCGTGETKPVALQKAQTLWPEEQFLATERSKVPHTGIIDAALIAEYGRRKAL